MRLAILLLFFSVQAVHAQPAATFLDDAELRRAIEHAPDEHPGHPGLYSLFLSPSSEYPVIGIRRTRPGKSEVHAAFTDVWYVIEGTATLVTGGAAVEGVETEPGETRGQSIKGGLSRRIQKGEFGVVPAGVPHWISDIEGREILYIVVKVPVMK